MFNRSNLKKDLHFSLSLQYLLQVINKLNMEKAVFAQSKTAEQITISICILQILTNNSHDICLIKQRNEITLSNQTGQTQKWVSF